MILVENRGVRIAFEDHGCEASQRLPIVLGHSFLCSGEMWRE
ncbi:hypothetical protein [Halomonas smyrnensis]|nr:hypothetical protein [Halomonas smyrnensis]